MSLTTNGSTANAWFEQSANAAAAIRLREKIGAGNCAECNVISYGLLTMSLPIIVKNDRTYVTSTAIPVVRTASDESLKHQAHDVVESSNKHQHHQDTHTGALSNFPKALRNRTSSQNLQRIIQQMAAI